MTTRALALSATLAAGTIALAAQQPTFRSQADAVFVDVSVLDGRRVVTGLTAADFELRDNGQLQTLTDVSRESMPVDATMLVDVSTSARLQLGTALDGLSQATRGLMRPGDRVETRVFGAEILDEPAWDGRRLGSWTTARATAYQRDEGGTSLFDALIACLIRPAPSGFRRLIVLLSDGADTTSFTTRATRIAILRRSDSVVDVIGLDAQSGTIAISGNMDASGITTSESHFVGDYAYLLQELADLSGGRNFNLHRDGSIVSSLAGAIEEFRTRYVLRYTPSGVSRDGWHDLSVRVKGRKYDVRARKGYAVGLPLN
ncbi:MAG TPA: VWA domain-containing protein [Vicinamibacterales bacterium]|nr:VWA domain-containing protein [Vicinamibacterales bacterium]